MSQGDAAAPCDGKHHHSPVTRDEVIFRRVLTGWYKPGKVVQVPWAKFMPRDNDHDGLSVIRKDLCPIEVARIRPDKQTPADVAIFPASGAFDLQLSIKPKAVSTITGDALIPEMNCVDLKHPEKETKIKQWALALRDLCTMDLAEFIIPATQNIASTCVQPPAEQ